MFKHFEQGQINTYDFKAHKTQSLSQADVTRHQFLSASNQSIPSSYYHFARTNFYLSGSDVAQSNPLFNTYPTVGNRFDGQNIFLSKFHDTGSVVSISQSLFGEEIKKGSFVLMDSSTATTIKIIDDSNGNLYAPDASFSQSVSALSSSDNYVGNIFYDIGAFAITETASFDGTNNYKDVTSGNYTVNYKGTRTLTTYDYTCELQPNELNLTENVTVFKPNTAGNLKDNLTSSLFPTFVTEVGLYDDNKDLMGYARLSKPIPKSTTIPMRFFVRMDY